jgi:hypothetical protein
MKEKKIKKIIEEKSRWWIHYLGLGFWEVHLLFSNVIREDRWGFTTHADTSVDWKYLKFTVTFYLKTLTNLTKDDLENMVVHELMHVFLNEMRESGIDHEERVASSLQKAFSWVEAAIRQECKEELLEEKEVNEKEVVTSE